MAAAKAADYVILIMGLDTKVEAEGKDRHNLTFPGVQADLIKEIVAIGKPTVLVLMNGYKNSTNQFVY